MVEWVGSHHDGLVGQHLVATASTGKLLNDAYPQLRIECVRSGPLGGDQEIGALIARQELGALVFLIDPLSPLPHDVDVKALTRLAVLYGIPFACNCSTADHVMRSLCPVFEKDRP